MAMADLGVMEMCWGLGSFSPLIDLRRACEGGNVVSNTPSLFPRRGIATNLHVACWDYARPLETSRRRAGRSLSEEEVGWTEALDGVAKPGGSHNARSIRRWRGAGSRRREHDPRGDSQQQKGAKSRSATGMGEGA
jgi:hypothetical protein